MTLTPSGNILDASASLDELYDGFHVAWSGLSRSQQGMWDDGGVYEANAGRWSRSVAGEFVQWLAAPAGGRWLDVGCGTGALSQAVLEHAAPIEVIGVDPSAGFIAYAESHMPDFRVRFQSARAERLPFDDGRFDAAVSGLTLNFTMKPELCVAEMARVTRDGGTVGAYVWDYADLMQVMRIFWDAASTLDPAALDLDEGSRFPVCRPAALRLLLARAGLTDIVVEPLDVPAVFNDFDEYWQPLLAGHGPAGSYVLSLPEGQRFDLRELIRRILPTRVDGSIHLIARAWCVRGRRA